MTATPPISIPDTTPGAAAVLADLLRIIEPMAIKEALVAESLAYGLLQGSREHARWLAE